MEKIHFEQAKAWLEHAKEILDSSKDYAVGVAMCIHAIIKSNDALTFKFLNKLSEKHNESVKLFETLIISKNIDPNYASYSKIVLESVNLKARAEYRGDYFSKNDLNDLVRKAEKFIKMVSEYIK